jgi:hypothetical protein
MFALVITIPLVIWVFGLGKIDEEDAESFWKKTRI